MKFYSKIIPILLISMSFYSPVSSQITLNSSDIMIPGLLLNEFVDTTTTTINFGNSGSGQTWDFSTLTEDTVWNSDIYQPSGQVRSNKFPNATAAIQRFGLNTQYYEVTNSEAKFIGSVVHAPFIDTMVFKRSYKFLEFPATLGSTVDDKSEGYMFFVNPFGLDPDGAGPHPTVDSIGTLVVDVFEGEIDASGTIKTPFSEYQALRQYSKSTSVDSAYMYANGKWQPMSTVMASFLMMPLVESDTSYTYAWMVKGGGLPVFLFEFEPTNNNEVLVIQWTNYLPNGIESSIRFSNLNVYPNPVQNEVNIINSGSENITYILYSFDGKKLLSGHAVDKTSLNLSGFQSGNYLLQFENEEGQIDVRKIIKQ